MLFDVWFFVCWNETLEEREEREHYEYQYDESDDDCYDDAWEEGNEAGCNNTKTNDTVHLPLPERLIGDLANDVHPLFARLNFPGARYEVLLPTLRLATLLIDTDCLLEYWHTLWFGSVGSFAIKEDESHQCYGRLKHTLSAKDIAVTRG